MIWPFSSTVLAMLALGGSLWWMGETAWPNLFDLIPVNEPQPVPVCPRRGEP